MSQEDYTIRFVREDDFDTLVELVKQAALSLPIFKFLEITPEEARTYARVTIIKPFQKRHGVVAENTKKQIVGCMFGRDFCDSFCKPQQFPLITPRLQPFFLIFKQLTAQLFKVRSKFLPGQCFVPMRAYVKPEHRGKQLSVKMGSYLTSFFIQQKYKYLLTEMNNVQHVQKILIPFQCKELASIEYKNFVYKGQKIFSKIKGRISIVIHNNIVHGNSQIAKL